MNWPDWNGEACAIVASGPSAKKAGVAALKGRMRVIAIKKSVELAPFSDVVYGCDGPWWRSVQGLMTFGGLKLAYDRTVCGLEYGIRQIEIPDPSSNELRFDQIGTVGAGGNSGFQALNLALQFGADRILLVGSDMNGEHWYGRNNWMQANNPDVHCYRRWIKALTDAAPKIAQRGASVINASASSELTCFPKMSIGEALQSWGMAVAA